jgi:uroporphyrin-III C-methyltransferase/precorrin-2 dehydrogenase/sirohydrochlorin ferrochelatase
MLQRVKPATPTSLLPLFLKLEGRDVLVVGAGAVAERKIASLLEAGATVRVVAPAATDAVRLLARDGRVVWREGPFEERDVEGAWLVFAATSDPEVQRRVSSAAAAQRTFCVAVDDPANASAYSGAVVARPPFVVAISSTGAAPALTRLVREVIEHVLPSDRWIEHATKLREKWLAEGTPAGDRFAELVRDVKRGA